VEVDAALGALCLEVWGGVADRKSHEFLRSFSGFAKITAVRIPVSDDLHLRVLRETDAEDVYALVVANRAFLAEWMPWAAEQDLARTANFIRGAEQRYANNDGFEMAVVLDDGRIAGCAGFPGVDWVGRNTSVGYWLAEEHQGRGLMTRAVSALVDHAFGEWKLHRVEIRAAANNVRSRAIPERLGFQQEGLLREAELVADEYQDLVVYGLLAADQ
jgi:ribosomal-protein-serine acetyltransferase